MNSPDRTIERTRFENDVFVSTVFLGMDHGNGDGPAVLFETMAFGVGEEMQYRYCTLGEAKRGHFAIVELLVSQGFKRIDEA